MRSTRKSAFSHLKQNKSQLLKYFVILGVSTTVATEVSGSTTEASSSTPEEHVTTIPTTETVTEERKSGNI